MSVLERGKVDFGHVDEDKITLCISDHIPWDDELVDAHLSVLQDKINDYMDFIDSGEIYEQFGNKGKTPNIKVIFCYEPVKITIDFLEKVKVILKDSGYELEWIFRPIDL